MHIANMKSKDMKFKQIAFLYSLQKNSRPTAYRNFNGMSIVSCNILHVRGMDDIRNV